MLEILIPILNVWWKMSESDAGVVAMKQRSIQWSCRGLGNEIKVGAILQRRSGVKQNLITGRGVISLVTYL